MSAFYKLMDRELSRTSACQFVRAGAQTAELHLRDRSPTRSGNMAADEAITDVIRPAVLPGTVRPLASHSPTLGRPRRNAQTTDHVTPIAGNNRATDHTLRRPMDADGNVRP